MYFAHEGYLYLGISFRWHTGHRTSISDLSLSASAQFGRRGTRVPSRIFHADTVGFGIGYRQFRSLALSSLAKTRNNARCPQKLGHSLRFPYHRWCSRCLLDLGSMDSIGSVRCFRCLECTAYQHNLEKNALLREVWIGRSVGCICQSDPVQLDGIPCRHTCTVSPTRRRENSRNLDANLYILRHGI